jgi:hypothetical protein
MRVFNSTLASGVLDGLVPFFVAGAVFIDDSSEFGQSMADAQAKLLDPEK